MKAGWLITVGMHGLLCIGMQLPTAFFSHAASPDRSRFEPLVRQEAIKAGLPADVADAVTTVESGYDPSRIGGVGEIGLMQVRPGTAAMMGFRGSNVALADPATNIHYGMAYLAEAWRQAGGDLCRALMKYRAGHGEERMTPLSVTYCQRARTHLASIGSPLAGPGPFPVAAAAPNKPNNKPARLRVVRDADGALHKPFRTRTAAVSSAFWASHEARIAGINARLDRRFHTAAR